MTYNTQPEDWFALSELGLDLNSVTSIMAGSFDLHLLKHINLDRVTSAKCIQVAKVAFCCKCSMQCAISEFKYFYKCFEKKKTLFKI